jgi:hypothetical protein
MTTLDKIAGKIIKEQELIIGPLAWEEATSVKGLKVANREAGEVAIEQGSDGRTVIDELVNRYVDLFGRAAREACREAAVALVADLPPGEVPSTLK